ncbi:MAG: hypothetical protein K2N56_03555 [Oscillospiraceae bacterium]|nr:hypothetical protein [Oscillospiraceae bacterium]
MGNYDRFEKLEMLGELDEKYIREAEKYLVQPLLADGEVIRLAPERRKFSFKTFAAAAAGLAVLIGGTAALSGYLNSRPIPPPVTNTSDSSDDSGNSSEIDNSKDNSDNSGKTEAERLAYLEKFREKCKVSDDITVAYARDRLNVIEFTLPDNSFFSDETPEKYRVIDEDRLLSNYNDSELRVYKINSSEYETIYKTADDPSIEDGRSVKITLKYTTSDYALFEIEVNHGDDFKFFDFKELRLIDLNTHAMETAESYNAFHTDSYFAINGDMLYFSDELSVRSYKIHSNEPSEFAANGTEPFIYNGRACYWHDDSPDGGGTPISARYIDDDKPVTDISAIRVLIGKEHITYYENKTLMNGATGQPIVTEIYRATYNNMAFDFGVLFEYKTGNFCIYNAHTNEVLVMTEDDPLIRAFQSQGQPRYSEYEGLLYGFNGSKGYIISEKPDPEAEKKQQYLDSVREGLGVSDDVNVAYMRDRLDVVKYSLPWTDGITLAADNKNLFIDSNRAIVSHTYITNNIEMYLFDTNEYVTLISAENDPLANEDTRYGVVFANKNIILFDRTDYENYRDLCVIELNKEGYPCTTIMKNAKSKYYSAGNFAIDGSVIYFPQNDSIYRYELGTGTEAELYVEEGVPMCVYNGDLIYYTLSEDAPSFSQLLDDILECRIIHSKSGTLPIEGERFGLNMWAFKYGILKLEDGKLIDCMTNKVIISNLSDTYISPTGECDFGIPLGVTLDYIYDAHANELLVLETGDEASQPMAFVSCNWGYSGSDPKGYLICEK